MYTWGSPAGRSVSVRTGQGSPVHAMMDLQAACKSFSQAFGDAAQESLSPSGKVTAFFDMTKRHVHEG